MTCTFEQARDDILAMVKAAWDPTTYPMGWPDVPEDGIPPPSGPWARTKLKHNPDAGGQRGFSDGVRRFERFGVLTIQVFTPKADGLSRCYQLAKILADGLEGKASPRGVWYRNLRIVEADDPSFSQLNVVTEFEYDEVK